MPANDLYFAYGSNLNLPHVDRFSQEHGVSPGQLVPLFPAFLPDHHLVFSAWSDRWQGGVANIIPAVGHCVPGMIYQLQPGTWKLLDLKENSPQKYQRVEKLVLDLSGNLYPVQSYQIPVQAAEEHHAPSPEYFDTIDSALHEWDLPKSHLQSAASRRPTSPLFDQFFFYGTLRQGECRAGVVTGLGGHYLGDARVGGKLLDLGEYPGMIDLRQAVGKPTANQTANQTMVHGELYRFSDLPAAIPVLDDIEEFLGYDPASFELPDGMRGSAYVRVLVQVQGASSNHTASSPFHPTTIAWTYRYLNAKMQSQIIASGDWKRRFVLD